MTFLVEQFLSINFDIKSDRRLQFLLIIDAFKIVQNILIHIYTGIWLGRVPIQHRLHSGEVITVVFLDSEGIGSTDSVDATDSTDNQIFTLSVLISSLLIYNSKNVPKNSDLEKLQ